VKDEAGLAFTPEGSPWSATLTEPLKPFRGITETVTVELTFPIVAEAETDETEIPKSGIAGGGGCRLLPPHPSSKPERTATTSAPKITLEVERGRIRTGVRQERMGQERSLKLRRNSS